MNRPAHAGHEVMETIAEARLRPNARITGVVYLLYFLTAIFGEVLLKGLIVSGDAAATANNILAHESLFRWGLAIGLLATACYIALTALFYDLFKPVDRNLSLIAAFLGLGGCAIQGVSGVFRSVPLVVFGDGRYLSVFNVEQLRALALLFLKLHAQASNFELVFFGFYDLLIGCLILKSTFLPRILGVLMAVAGAGWLTFLSPPFANRLSPYIQILGFLAEASLLVWLLVFGVNVQRWRERAGVADASVRT